MSSGSNPMTLVPRLVSQTQPTVDGLLGTAPNVFTLCLVLTSPDLPCLPPLYLRAAGDQRLEVGMA